MSIHHPKRSGAGPLPAARLSRWQAHHAAGNLDACLAEAQAMVAAHPDDGTATRMLGLSLLLRGDKQAALAALRKAARQSPNDAAIWDNLGVTLQRSGDFSAAAQAFRTSLRLAPGSALVWSNAAANALEAGDGSEALRLAERANALSPGLAEAWLGKGNALDALDRPEEAMDAIRQALTLKPHFPQALLSLGSILGRLNRYDEACATTEQALTLDDTLVNAHINLGGLYNAIGDMASASAHYRRAIDLNPARAGSWSGWLYCLSHDEAVTPQALLDAHLAFGRQFEETTARSPSLFRNSADPQRRLRVGFVSGDLRDHPVSRFIEPVWRELDRGQVEVVAYASQTGGDGVTSRLRQVADAWVDIARLSDDATLERIRADEIDILFDLSGHTAGNRLPVFAQRAAPVQVSWIGYPGTTGLRNMDYRLADAVVAPSERAQAAFSERLAYLPWGTVFARPENLHPASPLPLLERGYVTFGSFNRPNKLSDGVVALWSAILQAVPDARLLIGAAPDGAAGETLRARLQRHGIPLDRLELRPRVDIDGYLALHEEVDVLLDTFPFSSGTTANFALWMGVPTVTLAGDKFVQRLAASRMAQAGLDEFVAGSEGEYLALAARWSRQPAALARLRAELRGTMERHTREQPARLARALESRLRQMWQRWCAGLPPEVLR